MVDRPTDCDASIDGDVVELQAHHAVVGVEDQYLEPIHEAEGDLCIPATAEGGGRTPAIRDAGIGTPEDQHLDERVDDDAIGHLRTMAPEGMKGLVGG